jgi:hypothetical protein
MLNKNSIPTGILIGLIFPAIACVAAYLLRNNLYIINKPALPYFAAIALNLVMMRISFNKGADKTGRGIILVTFIFMVLAFFLKIHPIR